MITCPVNYMVDKFSENGNSVYYYFFKEVKYINVQKFNKYSIGSFELINNVIIFRERMTVLGVAGWVQW